MKVIYVGPHDRVVLPLPGGREREAIHGQQIDVEKDVAEGLLDQPSNWKKPEPAKVAEEVKSHGAS